MYRDTFRGHLDLNLDFLVFFVEDIYLFLNYSFQTCLITNKHAGFSLSL